MEREKEKGNSLVAFLWIKIKFFFAEKVDCEAICTCALAKNQNTYLVDKNQTDKQINIFKFFLIEREKQATNHFLHRQKIFSNLFKPNKSQKTYQFLSIVKNKKEVSQKKKNQTKTMHNYFMVLLCSFPSLRRSL
ncbi:hypothetical protein RFI_27073 [Reticulomyxa filosa]|uniref:Uncharacterized protein n=1 Tax=Reticulomyxa filosa TaxID=46433 RepID=X6M8I5_RETFI|nr:hypothetical protein RFI_27073 [Reticulomyxa filosa]|eukprot:ETO10303.1 hypothetical protein RFI_27073 [Reticulomyxa filosa]